MSEMSTIAKVVIVAAGAIFSGVARATAHGLAFEDALLDFLDKPTVATVVDYMDRTLISRSIAYSLLIGLSAAAGMAVDRLVDLARKALPNS